MTTDEIITINK